MSTMPEFEPPAPEHVDERVDSLIEATTIVLEHDGIGWSIADGLAVPVRIQSGILLEDAIGGEPIDEAVASTCRMRRSGMPARAMRCTTVDAERGARCRRSPTR